MTLTVGDQIYKYELKQKIGGGHFGEVWLSNDKTILKEVAIKVIDEKYASVAANLREAQVGNSLTHQNVVKVHYADVVNHNGGNLVLIAMDYHATGSILNLKNAENFVIAPRTCSAVIDVLRGLEYLHEQHLFHNDIKPSNILIGSQTEALLTDYGISCLSPNLVPTTAPNAYVLHRAPETASSHTISVTTDIYQVGMSLFRLLNGIGLISDLLQRVGTAEFERLKSLGKVPSANDFRPFIGNDLRRIVSKATNHDPSQRYQSALDMRRALEQIVMPGYWDAEPTGRLFGIHGRYKFTYEMSKFKNDFSLTAYRENLTTGRKNKISDFTSADPKQPKIENLKRQFMMAVVNGKL